MKRLSLLCAGAALTLTVSCSSSQQQEQMQEGIDGQQQQEFVENGQQEDGQEVLEDGNQAADFNEDMANNAELNGELNGELSQQNGVDNLNLNEAEGEIPENGLAADNVLEEVPEEVPAEVLAEGTNQGSNMADMSQEPMQGNMDSAPAAAAMTTGNGAQVYYATTGNTPVMSEPTETAQKVNVMAQGDFTLLWVNGEWGKTQTGLYVPMKYMSSKGIARPKTPSAWR